MKNEKNKHNNNKNKNKQKTYYWQFVKISYNKKTERERKKIIIIPEVTIALQIENNFYLQDLKKIKKTDKNTKHIKILERYKYIPADASKEQINYYIEHQRKRQEKFNIESNIGS